MKSDFVEFSILKRRVNVEVIADGIREFWCKACYLLINWRIGELKKHGKWEISTELYKEVAEHLYNYVYKDKMPPEPIAQTIMNAADDFVRGQPVRFRAGDYIALENYRRSPR